jgi:arylsulfatase A-like enzyme
MSALAGLLSLGMPSGSPPELLPPELLTTPAGGRQPHIVMMLLDDFGWADAGWHRNYTAPGGLFVPPTPEVLTPHMNALVADGIELDRAYVYKYCSPSRSVAEV